MNAEERAGEEPAAGAHASANVIDDEDDIDAHVDRATDPSRVWLAEAEAEVAALITRGRALVPASENGDALHPRLRLLEGIHLGLTGRAEEGAVALRALAEHSEVARTSGEAHEELASRAWEHCGTLFRMALDPAAALKAFRGAKRARAAQNAADHAVHETRLAHREAEALGSLGRLEEATERLLHVEAAGLALRDDMLVARALASRGSISFENGQLVEAAELYERAIAIADRCAAISHAMIWRGYRGQVELHRGHLPAAEDMLKSAIRSAKEHHRTDARALFQSVLATVRTYQGSDAEVVASRLFDEAIEDARAFPLIDGAVRIHALHLRLARAVTRFRMPDLDSELSRALAGISTESELLACRPNPVRGGRSLVDDSDDVRLALRLLRRRIAEIRSTRLPDFGGARVEIFSSARAFRVDGRIVSLSAHPTLRKVLARLAEGSAAEVPRAIRATALADAVWPGTASAKAKMNRLYVALAELRTLGLRGSLQKSADGYRIEGATLLGARITVPREDEPASSRRRRQK